MSSIRALGAYSPQIPRRKRPIQHGLYLKNDVRGMKVRANDVKRLMRQAVDKFGWLREENLPTLRKWAELEVIRRAAFAGIVQLGSVLNIDPKTREVSVKRLVDDHRKLTMSQVAIEDRLLMTPASRAAICAGEEPVDLVAMMAQATAPEEPALAGETLEVEPEPVNEAVEPAGPAQPTKRRRRGRPVKLPPAEWDDQSTWKKPEEMESAETVEPESAEAALTPETGETESSGPAAESPESDSET